MNRKKVVLGLRYLIIIVSSCCMITPFLWMLSASFKDNLEVFRFPIEWIPKTFRWDNYTYIIEKTNFGVLFLNSVKLMIGITLGQVVTCSLAAYAFSKIEFPERDTLILMEAFNPFGVFLLVQFFRRIPNELSEAARIDGLNEFGIYSQIIMPLCKPALASLVIFAAVKSWNEFLQPLIYLNSKPKLTIQLGLRYLVSENGAQYGPIMAASVLAIIPMVIIYILLQSFFEEGISTSGLKG